jgi:hypothetical protein
LSRRERCLDKPPKPLKAARIGVRQKEWMTRICREGQARSLESLVRSQLTACSRSSSGFRLVVGCAAAGRVPALVRPAAHIGDWVGSTDEQPPQQEPPDSPDSPRAGSQSGRHDQVPSGTRRTDESGFPARAAQLATNRKPPDSPGAGSQPKRLFRFHGLSEALRLSETLRHGPLTSLPCFSPDTQPHLAIFGVWQGILPGNDFAEAPTPPGGQPPPLHGGRPLFNLPFVKLQMGGLPEFLGICGQLGSCGWAT